jgi:hypothetical protein
MAGGGSGSVPSLGPPPEPAGPQHGAGGPLAGGAGPIGPPGPGAPIGPPFSYQGSNGGFAYSRSRRC